MLWADHWQMLADGSNDRPYRIVTSAQFSRCVIRLPTRTLHRAVLAALLCVWFLALASVCALGQETNSGPSKLPRIAINNNTVPAGVLSNGVLNLKLEISKGEWYPESEDGPHITVYAFSEAGKAPCIPGPLIRVPEGSQIKLRIHNTLEVPIKLHGLNQRPGKDTPVTLAANEEREIDFPAGAPGTYLYWAGAPNDGPASLIAARLDPAPSQLTGAFIVEEGGSTHADRVFVIGMWTQIDDPNSLKDFREFGTINGKSWPYYERLRYNVGETVHMRWINASGSNHPMHMHGSFYRIDATSDSEREDALPPEQRPMVVTHLMPFRTAMEITWKPDRPGRWLFHCHILAHIVESTAGPYGSLSAIQSEHPLYHEHGAPMVGLAIALDVAGHSADRKSNYSHPRKMTLVIQEQRSNPTEVHAQLIDGQRVVESAGLMGPPIVLHRGEPVEISVENHMPQETAIHWHGIELESYYDGVPEFSGMGSQVTPPILPGSKFLVRFTPPRAGTFIYHTHWHDVAQLAGGLYGPIIVLDAGQSYDPATDLAFVAGGGNQNLLINGRIEGIPLHWRAGQRYHVRLINIMVNNGVQFSLSSAEVPVRWRAVGKDGMQLPAAQQVISEAKLRVVPGETYDFEITAAAGDLILHVFRPGLSNLVAEKTIDTPIHVQ
jgi:FtsP/CotA-like multicopper oxidase with cupredoxin domain